MVRQSGASGRAHSNRPTRVWKRFFAGTKPRGLGSPAACTLTK